MVEVIISLLNPQIVHVNFYPLTTENIPTQYILSLDIIAGNNYFDIVAGMQVSFMA